MPMTAQWQGAFSVCDAFGAPIVEATTAVKHSILHPRYVSVQEREASVQKSGRHLYGGFMLPHFGHYILETLSRTWVLDFVKDKPESIVFLQYNGRDEAPPEPPFPEILSLLGIDVPFEYVTQPTTFEELIVPQQGLGMGVYAAGIKEHREFLARAFAKIYPKDPIRKLYISRSGYQLRRGGYLAEAWFEAELEKQGYTIFHPQDASIEDQVATYLAAERVISADNSALHVLAMAGRQDQDVAIVLRRHYGAVDLLPQLSVAHRKEPLVINAIQKVHCLDSRKPVNWGHYAEVDFQQIFEALKSAGFVDNLPDSYDEIEDIARTELIQKQRRFGGSYDVLTQAPPRQAPKLAAPYF